MHGDVAGVLFDDPEASRQTQARACARGFGGKKGVKQVRFDFFTHPGAGVRNDQHDVVTRTHFGDGEIFQVVFVQCGVDSRDGQFAAGGHGIAGVHREVHDNLFDLARVGLDVPCCRVE